MGGAWVRIKPASHDPKATNTHEAIMVTKHSPQPSSLLLLGIAACGAHALAQESSPVSTALSATTLSGSINTSAIWNLGTGNQSMPGRMFDVGSRQDGFNLDSFVLKLEKPLDEGTWSAGYAAEMLYGADAPLYGTSPAFPATLATGDLAIKQAYVSLRAPVGNGINFKVGVWDTPIGYEVYSYAANPTFSRSYGYFLEPFTHTGIQASYKFSDHIEAIAGVADPRGVFGVNQINGRTAVESGKSFIGTVILTLPESLGFLSGSTVYFGATDIQQDSSTAPLTQDRVNLYAGATVKTPLESLTLGIGYDYVANNLVNGDYANALAGYATYQITEKLKFNTRADYTWATDGTYFSSGEEDRYFSLTSNLDYALWANVLTRFEVRWDRDLEGKSYGNFGSLKENNVSLVANVVYKF